MLGLSLIDQVALFPPFKPAHAVAVLNNLGNTPIIDADIVAVAYVGQGFVVLAGQDYVLNSVTFTLSSVTGA